MLLDELLLFLLVLVALDVIVHLLQKHLPFTHLRLLHLLKLLLMTLSSGFAENFLAEDVLLLLQMRVHDHLLLCSVLVLKFLLHELLTKFILAGNVLLLLQLLRLASFSLQSPRPLLLFPHFFEFSVDLFLLYVEE